MHVDKKQHKALTLLETGRLRESEELFTQIIKSKPHDFISLFSLGVLMQKKGNAPKALEYIDRAIRVKPDFALSWYNRGFALQDLRRNAEAVESYDRVLSMNPTNADALVNRGVVLREMGRFRDAVENYERIIAFDPGNTAALNNIGLLHTDLKQYDEAIAAFEKLLRLDPEYDCALGAYCNVLQLACHWEPLPDCVASISAGLAAGKSVSVALELLTLAESPHEHQIGAAMFGGRLFPPLAPLWRGERYHHDKIRIAYISPDLQEHPVTHLMAGIFEQHDKTRFETIALSLGSEDHGPLRNRVAATFDHFIEVRHKSTAEIAELLRAMEIDIAIDLAGYTAGARPDIFSRRPAPIQVNYLGYPGTMGMAYYDYIVADKWVIPEADQSYFTEKVVYLPDSYLPADDTVAIAERLPTREEYGLPTEGFVFCSFNHSYKITPEVFDIWMAILTAIPASVLWLMKLNSYAEGNLQKEAAARGVDPGRLIFATRVPHISDHLARYRLADLFLDTTPYNAHTTASDALYVGLPVLTCLGTAFPGRVAGSLLHTIGMPELITGTLREYQETAIALAQDRSRLAAIRHKLQRQRQESPLFDTTRYCRNLEAAFTTMWQRQQQGKQPEAFAVTPPEPVSRQAAFSPEQTLQQALRLQEQGDVPQAAHLFSQLLEADPAHVVALYSLGVLTLNAGDPVASLHYFDRTIQVNPQFPLTWFNRGVVLQQLQRSEEALTSYRQAVALDPAFEQARRQGDALANTLGTME